MKRFLATFWPILVVISAILDKFWTNNLGNLLTLGSADGLAPVGAASCGRAGNLADFLVRWGHFSPVPCSGQLPMVGTDKYFRFFGQRLRIGGQQY